MFLEGFVLCKIVSIFKSTEIFMDQLEKNCYVNLINAEIEILLFVKSIKAR
jgi:hypothetical protein